MTGNKTLEVFYHAKKVGTLAMTPDKKVAFQYTPEWLQYGFSISPLSLPLRNDVFIPKDSARDYFRGLFGVFADSLPDSWGELLLDRYLCSKGVDAGSISALDRLAYIGASGMGALEYYPSESTDFGIDNLGLNYDEIAGECSKILSSRASDQLDAIFRLGGSSGGTRPKVLLREADKEWIVKFPAGIDPPDSGRREYEYSLCAKRCGIVMTKTELLDSNVCEGYFKTERFDRSGNEKIMTVTAAGLLEADFRVPSCDYSTYMKLIRIMTKDNMHDLEQMYRVMCFNVFAHNRDDHTKNFSFTYTDDKGWRLAPAYDLTYSITYYGEHTTSVNGKGKNIQDADLIKVGTDAGLSTTNCRKMLDEIRTETAKLQI